MSFNIRGASFEGDGVNAWKNRAGLNVATILLYNPDLIGFQELQSGNLRVYRRDLPEYNYIRGRRYNNFPPYNYPAIHWHTARLELLAWGGFWLGAAPDRPTRDWDARHVRSANWARLRHIPSGAVFLHLNTHLDHEGERARVEGARLIIAKLDELQAAADIPVLVTGDFNCHPDSTAHTLFTEGGFTDVYTAAGNEELNTCHAFQGDDYVPQGSSARIDWILTRSNSASEFGIESCNVLRDAQPPLYPSDHYPVLATLKLPGE